jgi:anthranilate phosphoribosyltransferase
MTGSPAPDLAGFLKEIGRGARAARHLDRERARNLGLAMLAGDVPPLELGAILLAYRLKGESVDELAGFMAAIDPHVARLSPPDETLRPVVLPVYNGARRLPNLTPLLALLLRRYGIPVLLHGMTGEGASFGRVTTAAVLWELGVEPVHSIEQAQRKLSTEKIAFVPTHVLAPAVASLLALRQRMGVRSVVHTLAKLIDPFGGGGFRVVPVTHPDYLARMREFLVATRASALLMRGTEGEPFAHPRRETRFIWIAEGEASEVCDADDAGTNDAPLPTAIDSVTTAAYVTAALAGEIAIPASIICELACCVRGAQLARQP